MALNIAINSLLLLLFKWQKTVSFIEMGSVFNWVNFISCSTVHGWEKWAAFLSSTTYQTPPPVVNFPLSWKWLIENKMFNSGLFEIKGRYINALFIFMYIQLVYNWYKWDFWSGCQTYCHHLADHKIFDHVLAEHFMTPRATTTNTNTFGP